MATPTADDLARVVQGQVGYVEGGGRDGRSGNITKYGASFGMDRVAWCSIFVWWCFMQIGIDLKQKITGSYASAELAMEGWQRNGWKLVKSPRLMDVVFFHFPNEAPGADHTGFVLSADAGGVFTVEGNTSSGNAVRGTGGVGVSAIAGSQSNGGGVYRRYRPYSQIIGYGRYPFPTPVVAMAKIKPVVIAGPGGAKTYPTLREGSKGPQVARLQALLHITADGDFGPNTTKHVKQAQFNRHLIQDGIAGPATLRALGF